MPTSQKQQITEKDVELISEHFKVISEKTNALSELFNRISFSETTKPQPSTGKAKVGQNELLAKNVAAAKNSTPKTNGPKGTPTKKGAQSADKNITEANTTASKKKQGKAAGKKAEETSGVEENVEPQASTDTKKSPLKNKKGNNNNTNTNNKRGRAEVDPDAPKRPNSSYFVFCIEKRPELMKANPEIGAKDITRLLGEGWRGLSKEEKEVYDAKYREGKEAYEKELTAYKLSDKYINKQKENANGEKVEEEKVEKVENKKQKKQKKEAVANGKQESNNDGEKLKKTEGDVKKEVENKPEEVKSTSSKKKKNKNKKGNATETQIQA